MSVRKRGAGWQADFTYHGQRYRETFCTKEEAETWEATSKSNLMQGRPLDAKDERGRTVKTLDELLEATRLRHWRGSKSEATAVKNAEDCVEKLGGDRFIHNVAAADIDDMVAAFGRSGLKDSTINRKLSALSKMLHHAKTRGWISDLPAIELRREHEHRIRVITPEEEASFIELFEDDLARPAMADLLKVLIDTGMRLGEALRLEFVDTADGWIRVWGDEAKSGRSRSIPQTERVAEVIARRRRAANGEERVFHDLDVDAAQYAWGKAREMLKLDGADGPVLHSARHTFCTRLAQKGVSPWVIQKLAGHASLRMTQRYTHMADADLVSAIQMPVPAAQLRIAQ
jgi:integrase